ncbi:MAG: hypothetical protein J0H68_01240 [Sphingobacteriia bacterium]|nr:hypothetical protein [Sphingobacteriia bacterium]
MKKHYEVSKYSFDFPIKTPREGKKFIKIIGVEHKVVLKSRSLIDVTEKELPYHILTPYFISKNIKATLKNLVIDFINKTTNSNLPYNIKIPLYFENLIDKIMDSEELPIDLRYIKQLNSPRFQNAVIVATININNVGMEDIVDIYNVLIPNKIYDNLENEVKKYYSRLKEFDDHYKCQFSIVPKQGEIKEQYPLILSRLVKQIAPIGLAKLTSYLFPNFITSNLPRTIFYAGSYLLGGILRIKTEKSFEVSDKIETIQNYIIGDVSNEVKNTGISHHVSNFINENPYPHFRQIIDPSAINWKNLAVKCDLTSIKNRDHPLNF